MNPRVPPGDPEACHKFRLLKQDYESALREEALYQCGGAASLRQAIQYESAAIAVSALARDRLIAHYKVCPHCETNRANSTLLGTPAGRVRTHVLLVDDFARHREVVRAMLRTSHDLQIVGEAADGPEAVRMAEELQPDVIVLDLNLPSLSGLAAARRIRKLSPGSKIIMASEECSDDIVQEAVRSGVVGYVKKSAMVEQLIPTIKAVLQGNRLLLGIPDL
jgi:CheY-like chemotaxis protein